MPRSANNKMKKVFNTISLIALIFTILYPIFISFNSELDLITKIINYLLSIGSIYFLYTIWENHKKFDSEIQFILNNEESINTKYKNLYTTIKKYLNL